jgi:hypothetical protein
MRQQHGGDRFELFYWPNAKGRWATFRNFGRMKLMLEGAHAIVENDAMFHAADHPFKNGSYKSS